VAVKADGGDGGGSFRVSAATATATIASDGAISSSVDDKKISANQAAASGAAPSKSKPVVPTLPISVTWGRNSTMPGIYCRLLYCRVGAVVVAVAVVFRKIKVRLITEISNRSNNNNRYNLRRRRSLPK